MKRCVLLVMALMVACLCGGFAAIAEEEEMAVTDLTEDQMRGVDHVASLPKKNEDMENRTSKIKDPVQELFDKTYEKYKDSYDREVKSMTGQKEVQEWTKKKQAEIRAERNKIHRDLDKTQAQKRNATTITEGKLKAAQDAGSERRQTLREDD